METQLPRLALDEMLSRMRLLVEGNDFAGWMALLADPVRARHAYWHLVRSGAEALPAIREGLRHPSADVRMYCTRALDHLVDGDSFSRLVEMLDDPDPRVRWDALHARYAPGGTIYRKQQPAPGR